MRRLPCLLLCAVLLISAPACSDNALELLNDAIESINDVLRDHSSGDIIRATPPGNPPAGGSDDLPNGDGEPDISDDFIGYVWLTYAITLTDSYGLLSGPGGEWIMEELRRCLRLYSPGFLQALVSMYAEYGSGFHIRLDSPSDDEYGSVEWDGDLTIYLRYDSNPEENGVTAATLSHELGHAIHFIVEEIVGEEQIENALREINRDFAYVGGRYYEIWTEQLHGAAFAYDYGMTDHYEDVATIFEMLADDPEGMHARLNDPANEALRQKTNYIRYLTSYVSYGCEELFAPLDPAAFPAAA
jgi:hypothetical protein